MNNLCLSCSHRKSKLGFSYNARRFCFNQGTFSFFWRTKEKKIFRLLVCSCREWWFNIVFFFFNYLFCYKNWVEVCLLHCRYLFIGNTTSKVRINYVIKGTLQVIIGVITTRISCSCKSTRYANTSDCFGSSFKIMNNKLKMGKMPN